MELVDYGMNSVSQGIDAIAITRVVIRPTGQNVKPGITPQVRTARTMQQLRFVDVSSILPIFAVRECNALCIHVPGERMFLAVQHFSGEV